MRRPREGGLGLRYGSPIRRVPSRRRDASSRAPGGASVVRALALAVLTTFTWVPSGAAGGAGLAAVAADPEAPAAPSASAGEWSTGTVLEPESVEEVSAALVRDDMGLVLAVAREPGGERVIGIVRLSPADRDFLDEGRSLEIAIDDRTSFSPPRLGGGLKSSTFFLWDGVGQPALGPLRDLMDARDRIVVRYPLAGGGHKEAALPAAGAKQAIAEALDVAADVSPEKRALATAQQNAVERCLQSDKPKERNRCLESLAACADATTSEELVACLDAKR